jgi:hypothetical protein
MKSKVAGLHLWALKVRHLSTVSINVSTSSRLWITTAAKSIGTATRKGGRVLQKSKTDYPHGTIEEITYHGTIDA